MLCSHFPWPVVRHKRASPPKKKTHFFRFKKIFFGLNLRRLRLVHAQRVKKQPCQAATATASSSASMTDIWMDSCAGSGSKSWTRTTTPTSASATTSTVCVSLCAVYGSHPAHARVALLTHLSRRLASADFKLQLAQTDYKDFLANEPSPLSTNVIKEKCVEKLVNEFNYLRINSAQPLAQFLDYITYRPTSTQTSALILATTSMFSAMCTPQQLNDSARHCLLLHTLCLYCVTPSVSHSLFHTQLRVYDRQHHPTPHGHPPRT